MYWGLFSWKISFQLHKNVFRINFAIISGRSVGIVATRSMGTIFGKMLRALGARSPERAF